VNTFNKNCPICSNEKLQHLEYKNEHFSFLTKKNKNIFSDLNILSCLECGFSYAYPFIDTRKLNEFYENEYSAEGGPHFEIYEIKSQKWKKYFSSRAASQLILAAQYTDLSKIKNFMDIGCGHGSSFRMLNKMKCDATYYGMEGGVNYQQDLNELNVNIIDWRSDTLNIDDKYNDFFDLILMSHVLEHFNALYLKPILKNINKYLKSGGVFICEVPNDNASYQLLESVNQAPHLAFFSQKSLIKIMKDCGFDIKYAQCVGGPVNTSINNKLDSHRIKLKKYIHRYSVIKKMYYILRQIFVHILILKKYYLNNNATTVINSENFIYGDDRQCIRICGIKK